MSAHGLSMELTSTLWSQRGAYIRCMVSEWSLIAVSDLCLWSQHGAYIHSVVSAAAWTDGAYIRSMVATWSFQCQVYGLSMEFTSALWSQHGAYIHSMASAWSLHPFCGHSMELTSTLWSQHQAYSVCCTVSAWSIQCPLTLSLVNESTLIQQQSNTIDLH